MKLTIIADFDGCTGTLEARQRLISQIIEDLKQDVEISHLDVMIGSARGLNFCHDFRGSYEHSLQGAPHKSCSILGDEFIEQLSAAVKQNLELADRVKVTFDNMLIGDILNGLSIGGTFDLMQAHRELYSFWAKGGLSCSVFDNKLQHIFIRPKKKLVSAKDLIDFGTNSLEVHDEYKLLMMYCIMQYQKLRYPNVINKFLFLDDRADILKAVDDFYYTNRDVLVPNMCQLQVRQFFVRGYRPSTFTPRKTDEIIIGSGKVNHAYAATVRDVAGTHNDYVSGLHESQFNAENLNDALSDIIFDKHSKALEVEAVKSSPLKRTVTLFNLSPQSTAVFADSDSVKRARLT